MSAEAKSLAKDIITELSDVVPGFDELWRKTEQINRIMAQQRILIRIEKTTEPLLEQIAILEEQIDSQS